MRKVFVPLNLTLGIAAALGIALTRGRRLSGSYLAYNPTTVHWLHLVCTADSRLSGQFVSSQIRPDGHLERRVLSITGAVSDGNVAIAAASPDHPPLTLSGATAGNTLTLIGTDAIRIVFLRADLHLCQRVLDLLAATSRQIVAAKSAAEIRRKSDIMSLVRLAGRTNGRPPQTSANAP